MHNNTTVVPLPLWLFVIILIMILCLDSAMPDLKENFKKSILKFDIVKYNFQSFQFSQK